MDYEMFETIGTTLLTMLIVWALFVLYADATRRREEDDDDDDEARP